MGFRWGVGLALLFAVTVGVFAALPQWFFMSTEFDLRGGAQTEDYASHDESGEESQAASCQALYDIRDAFRRRAEAAHHRMVELGDKLATLSGESAPGSAIAAATPANESATGVLRSELARTKRARATALAVAERVDRWSDVCERDARLWRLHASVPASCSPVSADLARAVNDARAMAAKIMASAAGCATAACPSANCKAGADMRAHLIKLALALDVQAGAVVSPSPALATEASKAVDDLLYAARLYPVLFDERENASARDIATLASGLLSSRSAELANLEGENAQGYGAIGAQLTALRYDLTSMSRWTSAAAANARDLGPREWAALADDLASALVGAAALRANLEPAAADVSRCPARAPVAEAAAEVWAAIAASEVCRRRSGCEAEGESLAEDFSAFVKGLSAEGAGEAHVVMAIKDETHWASALIAAATPRPTVLPDLPGRLKNLAANSAVALTVDPERSVCLRGTTPIYRVAPPASGEAPRSLVAIGDPLEPQTTYVTLPETPGTYELSLWTPERRGGQRLATTRIEVTPQALRCNGFDGRWSTSRGDLTIARRGNFAAGVYHLPDEEGTGVVVGRVTGSTFRGRWIAEGKTGGIRLVLAEGGGSFSGTFGKTPYSISGLGEWSGQCQSAAAAQPAGASGGLDIEDIVAP